ncbi:5'-3' exonuclease H3TH domain-containing protein, partial [Bacteroidota bacterium]
MQEKTLFLLDAYALIYRAYYAFINNPRINSKGLNTSAVFGFTNTLLEIISVEKPSHLAVVFDPPGPTFRHEVFPQYKAQRPPTPEDIKISIPYIKKIIEASNIPIFEIPGFEADDAIGTLAKIAEKEGFRVYMMTPDKDFYQLVTENIYLYKPRRSGKAVEIIGLAEVKSRFGIDKPAQVIDILALWGDSSDNIPGATGIGEKTAIKLIGKFGDIDNLYRNTEKLKGKQKENILNSHDIVLKARELVTISTNIPVDFPEKDMQLSKPDYQNLRNIFEELEFKSLITKLITDKPEEIHVSPIEKPQQGSLFETEDNVLFSGSIFKTTDNINSVDHNYILCDSIDKISDLAEQLKAQKIFSFDTETSGLDIFEADLIGISFSYEEFTAYFIPFYSGVAPEKIIEILKPVF